MFIYHIDVNSAYLSWTACQLLEEGYPVDLRTIPSVVGGDLESRRGIVLAKSIPAKRYGIQTGETLYQARSKCQKLVVFPPDYDLYMRCSNAFQALLLKHSPQIERYSVDECFLAQPSTSFSKDQALALGKKIQDQIYQKLGFSVNVGISTNKLLAKMASDFTKPQGLHTLYPEEIKDKLWPLPVRDLFMVGTASEKKLEKLNIRTIGQLAQADPSRLYEQLKKHGLLIYSYANGRDSSLVGQVDESLPKSVGNATTTAFDVTSRREALLVLLALCERATGRLRAVKKRTCCVSVSLKNSAFISYSHQMNLDRPLNESGEIFKVVTDLFDACWKKEGLRQLGVHLKELISDEVYQLCLLDPKDWAKKQRLDQAIDQIRLRYGEKALFRSGFLHSGLEPLQGGMPRADYPLMSSRL